MKRAGLIFLACSLALSGCVSSGTHKETLGELEQERKTAAANAAAFEKSKKESTAQIEALQQENARVQNELLASQGAAAKAQQSYETAAKELKATLDSKRELEGQAAKLRRESEETQRLNGELARERELLKAKVSELETQAAALEEDKRKLIARVTASSDEIAKLQRESGQLHTTAAAEHETLSVKLAAVTGDLDQSKQQIASLTGELDQSKQQLASLSTELNQSKQQVATLTGELSAAKEEGAQAKQERDKLLQQSGKMAASIEVTEEQLKREREEKERLEKERAAKEAELQRLKQTQANLSKSLEAEIAKGDIKIQQIRDRLSINMLDKVLFDSGKSQIKPNGLKVLKQVGDILKDISDKQIRIEGHTDNVPIKGKLKERFPTNWELSTARATSVVRYLIENGGVGRENLEAVGFADTRPVQANETPEGRASNRRIEIVLYPKDLEQIAGEIK